MDSKNKNIMTIPCVTGSDSKILPKLIFLLRKQQSKLNEICSFLDFIHFDVLSLSSTPNPEIGFLEAIYDMKRVIISQQSKIDMLRAKSRSLRSRDQLVHFPLVYWVIIALLLVLSMRIISILPSQDVKELLNSQLEINLKQDKTIASQAVMISLLQEELRQTREFYWYMTKVVVGILSIGFYALSGFKNKIRSLEKVIVDQIYKGLVSGEEKTSVVQKQSFSLLLLSLITFAVFVGEMYMVSTLI